MADVIAFGRRPTPSTGRLRPPPGRQLALSDITGMWRPTCSIEACGVFAVAWETPAGQRWAPLHDFCVGDQLRLIDACRQSFVSPDDLPALPGGRAS